MPESDKRHAIFWSLFLWVLGGAMILAAVLISESWFEVAILTVSGVILVSVGIHTFRERHYHPVAQTMIMIVLGLFSLLMYLT